MVKLEDDDNGLLLLNTLPKMYERFKDTLLFRKEHTIAIKEVQTSIRTKALQNFQKSKGKDNVLSLNISKGKRKKKEL